MHPHDSGPIYRETILGRLPVEPWNTFSNVVFLLVGLYWAWRVYPHVRRHAFLAFTVPVLFIGFVGGTLFHGTRSHEAWLLMDWVPIVLLCMCCVVWFARRAGVGLVALVGLVLFPLAAHYAMLFLEWTPAVIMNMGYVVLGITVLLPIVLHLSRNQWRHRGFLIVAVGCFAVAITFRSLDHDPLLMVLPMGTHWLWHIFGGLSVGFLMAYIHADDLHRVSIAQ